MLCRLGQRQPFAFVASLVKLSPIIYRSGPYTMKHGQAQGSVARTFKGYRISSAVSFNQLRVCHRQLKQAESSQSVVLRSISTLALTTGSCATGFIVVPYSCVGAPAPQPER